MKKSVLKILIFIAVAAITVFAGYSDVQAKDRMDTLGGNRELIKKARALDPKKKMRIVQRRAVDRNWRLELGVNYGMVAGGDPYLSTQNLGGSLDLHINPKWSVGMRYYDHYNELTSEGRRVFDDAQNSAAVRGPYDHPAVDFPLSSTMGVISFYPVYGKLNLFDLSVAQFDLYVLGGYGETKLESGSSPTWTAGGGVGLWMNQHFSSRFEVRYQSYEDRIWSGPRDVDVVIGSFSIGFLL